MESYATSATGRLRRTNEDAVLCEAVADGHVLAVCDGVGGHRAGAVASGIATTVIRTAIVDGLESGWPDPEDLLANALREAGEAIRHEATRHPQYRGMRTTAVVALVRDGAGFVAAVGDSRAYLVREELEQITTDHSLAAGAIDLGDRMPDGVAVHPFRHVVTQSLGMYGSVAPITTKSSSMAGSYSSAPTGCRTPLRTMSFWRLSGRHRRSWRQQNRSKDVPVEPAAAMILPLSSPNEGA